MYIIYAYVYACISEGEVMNFGGICKELKGIESGSNWWKYNTKKFSKH